MSDSSLSDRIAAGQQAVMAQTALMHAQFGKAASSWKDDGTRVTAADIAISEGIFAELSAKFSADQYFSEELSDAPDPIPVTSEFCWVLDPIDGTNNYANGIAYCAIGLALLQDGMPVYGWVYDMSRRSLFHGGPGFGVWDGDQPAKIRGEQRENQRLIGFHSPRDKQYTPHAEKIIARYKIRGLGSSTLHLAYLAAGFLDGVIDHNVKVWDIAAAVPLAEAMGAEQVYLTKSPFPLREFDLNMDRIFYVAGSAATVAEFRTLLNV